MLTLDTLHAAAERHARHLGEKAATLRERETRDIANAAESGGSVGDSGWKDRWRAEVKARAAARVSEAFAELRKPTR